MEFPSAGAARDGGLKLGLRQFAVLAHRQMLVKRRAPLATIFEVMACVVLMSLLVLGADMSRVVTYPQRVFADKGVNVSSSAYAFVRDLVEFESEELCANITDDDWNATAWLVNRTSAASDAASNASATAADGLSLLASLASDPTAARAAADTQAFLVRRLGLTATVALESALLALAESPSDPDASLAVFRELQSQSRAGVDLGLDDNWTRLLNDADTSTWDALVEDAVNVFTPLVVARLLGNDAPLPVPSFDEFAAVARVATFAMEANEGFRRLYKRATTLGVKSLGNLLNLGKLGFAPDTPATRDLVARLNATHAFFDAHFAGVWPTEADALTALNKGGKSGLWAVVAMRDLEGDAERGISACVAGDVGCGAYAIRMRFTVVPRTQNAFDRWSRVSDAHLKYYTSGFLSLQNAVDSALIGMATGASPGLGRRSFDGPLALGPKTVGFDAAPVVWGVPFPRAALRENTFYDALGPLLGLLMCLSTLYPVGMLVKGLVQEKETRTRELMSIMGLQSWALAAAHATTYAVVFFLVALFSTALLHDAVFPTTDWTVLFAFFLALLLTGVPLGFLISAFFSRARLASIVGPFALFAMGMPRYVFFDSEDSQALSAKRWACLLTPTAFTFAADLLATREGAERGVTWETLYDDPLSLGEIMGLACVGGAVYAVAAWYLGKTLPSAYGTPLPWWFPFDPAYWRPANGANGGVGAMDALGGDSIVANGCASKGRAMLVDEFDDASAGAVDAGGSNSIASVTSSMATEAIAAEDAAAATGATMEPVEGLRPAVVIRGLSKTYNPKGGWGAWWNGSSAPTRAVRSLNLALYEGQVTGLLGPNGAGKSTTVAMLTGLTPPTKGDAIVAGHSLRGALADARRVLGVCPQMNVLFPSLTCAEHLRVYATLKGVPAEEVAAACLEKLREVGLEENAHARAETLSGGMKRRLQMAMALVGPSRVVLLDEPTSGLDPKSRRDAWRLIRAAAKGRCVVLTTHFLEEADLLCDRVAIVSDGKLRCAGSPVFLKSALGDAYALTMTFDASHAASDRSSDRSSHPSSDTASKAAAALALVRRTVPDATLRRARGGEAAIELPGASAGSFPELFAALDARVVVGNANTVEASNDVAECSKGTSDDDGDGVRLRGYGVSMTTLEEIFLRLAEDDRRREEEEASDDDSDANRRARRRRTRAAMASTASVLAACASDPTRAVDADPVESSRASRREIELSLVDATVERSAPVDTNAIAIDVGERPTDSTFASFETSIDTGTKSPTSSFFSFGGATGGARREKMASDFRVMLRKRVIVARRDRKGLFYNIFVPILVNALVMCVLFLEVSPAGPNRAMTPCMFTEGARPGDRVGPTEILAGGPTTRSARSLADPLVEGSCATTNVAPLARDGVEMSARLLEDAAAGAPARYLAVIRDDPLAPRFRLASCVDAADGREFTLVEGLVGAVARAYGVADEDARLLSAAASTMSATLERYSDEPITTLHNVSAPHALPAFASAAHAAIARDVLGPSAAVYPLAHSHPLPLTAAEKESLRVWMNTLAAFFLLLPFSYLAATYAAFVVKERATRATLQQLASGCDETMYWLGAAVAEFANHAVVCVATWTLFFAFDMSSLVGTFDKAAASFVLLLAFGAASVPLSFVYSLGFRDHASTIVALSLVNFVTGFVLVNLDFVMRSSEVERTRLLGERLSRAYRAFPPFLLGEGLVAVSTSHYYIDNGQKDETESWLDTFAGMDEPPSPFEWELAGRPIAFLLVECAGYFALLVATRFARRDATAVVDAVVDAVAARVGRRPAGRPLFERGADGEEGGRGRGDEIDADADADEDEDADVAAERAAVRRGASESFDVVLDELVKAYPRASAKRARANAPTSAPSAPSARSSRSGRGRGARVAVDRLTLGVRPGERFGLLGVNGAGKSTTLKTLCGEHAPTSGSARVCGRSVTSDSAGARRVMGYCPQFDPLLDLMTGRETAEMYARLKGASRADAPAAADAVLRAVGLTRLADRPCGEYSGGNRRKLSLAVALVGDPRVLLLDEPSSGMCPLGRRMMWDAVERSAAGKTVVLTTHAMDECEALCERVGMMAEGKLRCLGSAQHLKGRFGGGYAMDVKISAAGRDAAATSSVVDDVFAELAAAAPEGTVRMVERAGARVKIRVEGREALAAAFLVGERRRAEGVLEHYAVTQSSLEDVFVRVCE